MEGAALVNGHYHKRYHKSLPSFLIPPLFCAAASSWEVWLGPWQEQGSGEEGQELHPREDGEKGWAPPEPLWPEPLHQPWPVRSWTSLGGRKKIPLF